MKNFYEQFAALAERFAARPAVEVQRRHQLECYTYAELRAMAECAAAFLAARGLEPGERAAILADNDARWCAAYLGALRVGGVAVPLDTGYGAKQIAALLHDCGARVLFTSPKYLAAAQEAAKVCGPQLEIVLLRGSAAGFAGFDQVLAQPREAEKAALPPCPAGRDDPAVILYTSGTTSDPKGVVLTHGNLLGEMKAVFGAIHVDERDVVLGVLPLFHGLAQMANLLLPFSVGARVVFLETVNVSELLRALGERQVTAFACVPQFFYLIHQRVIQEATSGGFVRRLGLRTLLGLNGWLREHVEINPGRFFFRRVHRVLGRKMRLLVTGGSRFDPGIGRDLYRLGFTLLQAYGLTESSGAATLTPPGKYTASVGLPLPGVEVKIACPVAEQARGEAARDGEVLLRGPIVMQGYFNRPDASAAALADGWLHTGDLGYLGSDGQLHITGRSKEVIVLSSGKNIYPEEIEAHYQQSPYIKELCLQGLARPDEPSAERLHAVVVPDFEVMRQRKVVNMREVLRFEIESLSIRLPPHQRILGYEIWTDELPRTTTRKLKRFEIERRQKERQPAREEAGAEAPPSEADLAWASRLEVARALELVRAAAKVRGAIRPDANIELELGLDSMERVELLTQLEHLFGTNVPDEVAHRIYTLRELVEACLPEGAAPARAGRAPCAPPEGDVWAALLKAPREDDPEFAALLRPRPVFTAVMFAVMKLCNAAARLMFRFRTAGRENLPAQGAFLLCPNHQSYLDAFLLVSALPFRVFRKLFFVGASEYFATPLMRWFARMIYLVPVDPDTNLLRAMQAGAFGLRHGRVLVLFPEGERSIDGEPKKFKKGAPILSLHMGAPMVPVALDGVFDVWPRGRGPRWRAFLPGGPGRITVRFGAPLPPPAQSAGVSLSPSASHYAAAAEELRSIVLEMWHSLRKTQPG